MDFGLILDAAFAFTKLGVFKNTDRWLTLILPIVCLGIPLKENFLNNLFLKPFC